MTYEKWQIGHVVNCETNSTEYSLSKTSAMYKKDYVMTLFILFLEKKHTLSNLRIVWIYFTHVILILDLQIASIYLIFFTSNKENEICIMLTWKMFPSKHFFLSTVIRVAAPLLFALPIASIFILKSIFVFPVGSLTQNKFIWNLLPKDILKTRARVIFIALQVLIQSIFSIYRNVEAFSQFHFFGQ